jgi:hypothetical protein
MKRFLSLVLCAVLLLSVLTFNVHAEGDKITVPDFNYPAKSYPTLKETGIPYDELFKLFPEKLETKYENGAIYIKDLGNEYAYYVDRLDYDGYEGVLVDGYWKFEASEEAYNSGGNVSMYTGTHSWHASYDVKTGERGVVSFDKLNSRNARIFSMYPEKGYGKEYVNVIYDLRPDIRVTDAYAEGVFVEQAVSKQKDDVSVHARYDNKGNVKWLSVSVYETDENVLYIPGKGWSESTYEYIPVKAPTGFENMTFEELKALVPTDITCEHQWSEVLCDSPSVCALCKREKGVPLGHEWVNNGTEYETCTTCKGIRYIFNEIKMPSFSRKPAYKLSDIGINMDDITLKLIKNISVEYEDGTLKVPNGKDYYFSIDVNGDFDFNENDYLTQNGWNIITIAEDKLDKVELEFDKSGIGGEKISNFLTYDANGALTYFTIYTPHNSIGYDLKKNTVRVSYSVEGENISYTDVYQNGIFQKREVYDEEEEIKICYDSDLKIEKVRIFDKGDYLCFIPDTGWKVDIDNGKAVPTPDGFEGKDAKYFSEKYPHGIDFCIHSFENTDAEYIKKCSKCGETVVEATPTPNPEKNNGTSNSSVTVIIVGALVLAFAVAAVIIIIKKKKGKE